MPENINQFGIGGQHNPIVGLDLASAAIIAPTHKIHKVTGTVTIDTITPPWTNFAGEIHLVIAGACSFSAAGNIAEAINPAVGDVVSLVYNPVTSKWYAHNVDNGIYSFTATAAAGAANVTEVTITAKDRAGNTVAAPVQFDLYLSDSATGVGHTATAASGTVQAKAASGLVVDTQVAKKALRVQALGTGVFILEITDTGKTAFKVCAVPPATGRPVVAITLAAGDYGA